MRRIIAVAGALLCSMLALEGTALALHGDIPPMGIDIDNTAFLTNGSVAVTGTVTCSDPDPATPPNATFRIGVTLSQNGATGQGKDQGDCTGAPEDFRVVIAPDDPNDMFQESPPAAEVNARAQTGDNTGTIIDDQRRRESISIVAFP